MSGYAFLRSRPFGALPSGERLARAEGSPQWRGGSFENLQGNHLERFGALWSTVNADDEATPSSEPAYVRTDPATLAAAPSTGLRVTWFGHSSALVEVDGVRVLTDPFWGDRAGPGVGPRRFFPNPIAIVDLPEIDAVVISHDHWDHLDEPTITALRSTEARFVVPLGVGAHLSRWGVPDARITELDWWEDTTVGSLTLTSTAARHESGRGLTQGKALWSGWALTGPEHRVWYSGDSSFHPDLAAVGERLGPFDVTLIESGQYDEHWPDNHWGPELAVRAHQLVRGERMVPVHWALLSLAPHAWTEPVERVRVAAACHGVDLLVLQPGAPTEPTAAAGYDQWWPNLAWRRAAEAPVLPTRNGDPQVRMPEGHDAVRSCTDS